MKKIWLAVPLVCAVCMLAAGAQSQTYQDGKIVDVHKLATTAASGGTDAPTMAQVDAYEISVQIADTVYVCHYTSHSEQDLSWTQGKDVQARVKGKTVYVKKANGKDAMLSVKRTTKASTP
jgi:molybdopterin-binding protein